MVSCDCTCNLTTAKEISDFEATENAENSDNFPDHPALQVREARAEDILFLLRLKQI